MDVQLKKGFLEYSILAVLAKADSYGYQIIKDISICIEISESTLYPILRRLETGGYLTTYTVEHNSRLRKYYKITDSGHTRLDVFLNNWEQILGIYNFIKGVKNNE